MARADADRNLLFGILALQMDFISRDALIAAMHAWALDKGRSLGEILVASGALGPRDRDLLEPMVARHVQIHGDDPARSLAALGSASAAREGLDAVADPDVHASLGQLGTAHDDDDPGRTASYVGAATSAGGRFRILRFHDRGALGEVFVARDQELHREVALKQIKGEHADDARRRARFLVEAEVTGGLEHPGIVPVYGLGTHDDGRPFYAMRFIRGDNLRDAIARFHAGDGPARDPGPRALELRRLLGRFLDVCNALAYAHSRGVLHRDLKPGNIMLGEFGETLIVDWGLAKVIGRPGAEAPGPEGWLVPGSGSGVDATEAGSRLGTPAFMSPEQAAGRLDDLGPASDVYSLGATLYCLLTGRKPFEDHDLPALLRKVERGEFAAPRAIDPRVDPALDAICRRAMALHPADRYASPRRMADDIEHWLADEPVEALPETRGRRLARWARRHRTWARSGAAALLLVTGVAVAASIVVNQARRRERSHRIEADRSRGVADIRRAEAEQQRREADAQRSRSESRLAQAELDRGLNLCEQGDYHAGVLWLARGLKDAPDGADDLRRTLRLNLDAWSRRVVRPARMLRQAGSVDELAFAPDGKTLATVSSGRMQLWEAATGRPVGAPIEHARRIGGLAFRPDSGAVASVDADGTARLWDVATGEPLGPPLRPPGPPKPPGSPTALAFAPDGRTLATITFERIQLWDATTGEPSGAPISSPPWGLNLPSGGPEGQRLSVILREYRRWRQSPLAAGSSAVPPLLMIGQGPGADNSVAPDGARSGFRNVHLALSPDGTRFAILTQDSTFRIWDSAAGKPIAEASPGTTRALGRVTAARFSPDGKVLAVGDVTGVVVLRDAATGQALGEPALHRGPIANLAFSPDGRTILSGSDDATARLWDAATGRPAGPPLYHPARVHAVAFTPDGQTIATASGDTVRLWPMVKPAGLPLPHRSRVSVVGFSPDGKLLATRTSDREGEVSLWDAATGRRHGPPLLHPGPLRSATFSPDGKLLAAGCYDQRAWLWDVGSGRPAGPPIQHPPAAFYPGLLVAFRPDGKLLATASGDGTARLWEVGSGRAVGPPMSLGSAASAVAFRPDGRALATVSERRQARLWDVATGQPLGGIIPHEAFCLAFRPDGRLLATGGTDGRARLWDAATGRAVGQAMPHRSLVHALAFRPDGRALATSSEDALRLWDAATGRPLTPPIHHESSIGAPAFSPGGTLVGAGGDATTAWLRDAATGRPVGPPLQHQHWVTGLAFSPDGRTVATASTDTTARLWDAPAPVEVDREEVEAWAQVLTAAELDPGDAPRALEAGEWAERRRALEARGVPADRPSRFLEPPLARLRTEARSRLYFGAWREALGPLDRLIAATPGDADPLTSRATALSNLGRLAEASKDADAAIGLGGDRRAYSLRAEIRIRLRRWDEAAADLARLIDLDPDDHTSWYYHAYAMLRAGRLDAYRRRSRGMLERFGATTSWDVADRSAKVNLLVPDRPEPVARAVELAERALRIEPTSPWTLYGAGLAAYRAGRYAQALDRLGRGRQAGRTLGEAIHRYQACSYLVEAMAAARLDRLDEARLALGRAESILADQLPPDDSGVPYPASWVDWVHAEVLLREARVEAWDHGFPVDPFGP